MPKKSQFNESQVVQNALRKISTTRRRAKQSVVSQGTSWDNNNQIYSSMRQEKSSLVGNDCRPSGTGSEIQEYQERGISRFRKIAKGIRCWLSVYLKSSSQVRDVLRYAGGMAMSDDDITSTRSGLTFSVADFKANKRARLSQETLEILKGNPLKRTKEEIRLIETGLLGYNAVADMSKSTIRQISEKAWYQEFDPLSVIVREGDWPLYFYIILSGEAYVSIINKEAMTANLVCTLKQGDTFGELSLIYRTRRNSTVITKAKTGLLILIDDDYKEVFMNGGIKLASDPFFSTVDCFIAFDMEVFRSEVDRVKFSYFRPGEILVEDSHLSDWIFVIKSGKANVVMPIDRQTLSEAEKNISREVMEEDIRVKPILVTYPNLPFEDVLKLTTSKYLRKLIQHKEELVNEGIGIPGFDKTPEEELRSLKAQGRNSHDKIPYFSKAHFKKLPRQNIESRIEKEMALKITPDEAVAQGKRTLATDLNMDYYLQQKQLMFDGGSKTDSILILIQTLTCGDYFGLAQYIHDVQPSLKLISDGCECFVIHKELYMDYVTEEATVRMSKEMRPFPEESDVISRKIEHMQWTDFRKEIYRETRVLKEFHHVDVHDSFSRFPNMDKYQIYLNLP